MDSNAVASAEPSASPAVRELLQRAADEQVGLEHLRAGELTEHEWTLIAIGALIVLILVIV